MSSGRRRVSTEGDSGLSEHFQLLVIAVAVMNGVDSAGDAVVVRDRSGSTSSAVPLGPRLLFLLVSVML